MNYIKQLQVDIDARKAEKLELSNGINELKGYLSSSKFWIETTVQVADVLHRLAEIEHNAGVAFNDFENAAYVADEADKVAKAEIDLAKITCGVPRQEPGACAGCMVTCIASTP